MQKLALGFSMILLLCACENRTFNESPTPPLTESPVLEEKVIYGTDDRKDLYEVRSALQRRLADSTVALIKEENLQESGAITHISAQTFRRAYNLCASEKFGEQENAAFCSGSLIAPDIIATAGHCIRTLRDCASTRFVFGYALTKPGVQPKEVASSEVYGCSEIIHSEVLSSGSDFALIRLDRKVGNHAPLKLRKTGGVKVGSSLFVIGHPAGLPTKVATGAKVRNTSETEYFTANLDTYGGNSGSAVFNSSGVIEGILVRGDTDFTYQGSCTVSNRCTNTGCRGEDVTRITRLRPYLGSVQLLDRSNAL